jgi:hypothetical protein
MNRHDPVSSARGAIAQFRQYEIKIPKPVADEVANLDRVAASNPPDLDPRAAARAIADGATPEQVAELLTAALVHPSHRQAVAEAARIAAGRVLAAIKRTADEIHEQFRAQALDLIEKLEATAELDVPLNALIRAGRDSEARLLADVDLNAEALNRLYQVRSQSVWAGERFHVNGANCGEWRDPRKVESHLNESTLAGNYLAGIRAGGELWFATPEESRQAGEVVAAELAAEAAEARQNQLATYGI